MLAAASSTSLLAPLPPLTRQLMPSQAHANGAGAATENGAQKYKKRHPYKYKDKYTKLTTGSTIMFKCNTCPYQSSFRSNMIKHVKKCAEKFITAVNLPETIAGAAGATAAS
jgi:hypothetical protein